MNESEFENELRALRPAAPSPALEKRIAAEMPAHAITVATPRALDHAPAAGVVARPERGSALLGLLRGLLWAAGGAAVAVVCMLFLQAYNKPPEFAPLDGNGLVASSDVAEQSAESVSELIDAKDEGLIYDEATAEPQRQMRYTYLERHVWTNPRTGAVIEFEVPREDIVLMPVAMQ